MNQKILPVRIVFTPMSKCPYCNDKMINHNYHLCHINYNNIKGTMNIRTNEQGEENLCLNYSQRKINLNSVKNVVRNLLVNIGQSVKIVLKKETGGLKSKGRN
ncbi:Zn finger protein [Bacillus phage AR9]|uniref:Zn finger protein n=2 Tax=Bacillus phage PBS1 TaxID=10683 RepID=A0A172JI93_BPPB1|nr:zinc-finger domain protein [Bacillus phage AR9]YP_009664274.1 zinc-finger domain protein [Bacillus phage PBS1]PTU25937.1 hypothetical protein DA469_21130 [Bacillus subtilis]AMS01267.1 Zn finger protein [Bacillus phage AR9]AST99894.1 hypothetical protein PBI_PBS1_72 [Bacillus phage PBS1]BDE75286.1 hypothetical protein [Bacillus phage PBS1]